MELNFYSTGHAMSASSCWVGGTPSCYPTDLLVFGFSAVGARVFNTCGDRLFYSLTGAPTTAQADVIAGCSALTLSAMAPFGGLSLMTTSSSCTNRPLVGVSAWASA
mgnify:FL=1